MDTTRTPPGAPVGASLVSSTTKASAASAISGQKEWERAIPQVSVVIPTVGDRPWLTEAVASALGQVGVDLEVIVVANRPGTTLELPDDPRVQLVEEPLAGKAYAVNRGALVARGRWLALLDGDDRWETGKLSAQLERLAQCPEAVGCYTQFHFVDKQGRQVQLGHAAPTTYLEVLAGRWVVLNSSLLLDRRLYFVLGGISPLTPVADDVDLVARALRIGQLAYVPEPLVAYRLHPGNISGVTSYRSNWLGAFAIGCANLAAARLDGDRMAAMGGRPRHARHTRACRVHGAGGGATRILGFRPLSPLLARARPFPCRPLAPQDYAARHRRLLTMPETSPSCVDTSSLFQQSHIITSTRSRTGQQRTFPISGHRHDTTHSSFTSPRSQGAQ